MIFQYSPSRVARAIVTPFAASIGGMLVAIAFACAVSSAEEPSTHRGDVTDMRVIRRVEQHPYAGRYGSPSSSKGTRRRTWWLRSARN